MFASGDRASWLNAVAAKIMDGGDNPPSIDRLILMIPPIIVTAQNDGHVTAAAAFGEKARNDYRAGQRVIIEEMVMVLREQGFVGGSGEGLTWIKPLDGIWKVAMPDGRRFDVFGQRERRMDRDRSIVGERSEIDGSRVGPPSRFEQGRLQPFELQVVGARGGVTLQKLELHPLALAIPAMTETERENLRKSIERDGVKVPIVLFQKKILDGRNRAYYASVFDKPIHTTEFIGTEEEAKRHVIALNLHRRHLNAVQIAVIAEELFGKKADEIVAEAPVKRDREDIVTDLAKDAGIKTTRHAVTGVQELMNDAPETLAQVKSGKYHKMADAIVAAHKEKGNAPPVTVQEVKPKSVNTRLGACIENLNKIILDSNMPVGSILPEKISDRLLEINRLVNTVERALRDRQIIR